MKRRDLALAVFLAGTLGLAGMVGTRPIRAQQQVTCLHGQDESDAQKARRRQALQFVRHVNSLEAVAVPTNNGLYKGADQLQFSQALPDGFQLRLSSSGKEYAFSVLDTTDQCRFGYFSDQNGLIFRGEAIRNE
jgi:hypothetical protein